jgi:hypothetical protein
VGRNTQPITCVAWVLLGRVFGTFLGQKTPKTSHEQSLEAQKPQ